MIFSLDWQRAPEQGPVNDTDASIAYLALSAFVMGRTRWLNEAREERAVRNWSIVEGGYPDFEIPKPRPLDVIALTSVPRERGVYEARLHPTVWSAPDSNGVIPTGRAVEIMVRNGEMYTYVASDTRRDVRRLPTELGGFRDLKESTDGLTPAMRGLQGAGDRVDTAEIEALAGTLWDADARGYDLEEHEQRQRHGAVLVIPGFQLVEAKPPRVQYLGAQ